MRTARLALLTLLALYVSAASLRAFAERVFTLPEYKVELTHLLFLADNASDNRSATDTAIDDLRGDWKVKGNGQTFEIHTGWLVDHFEKLKDNSDPQIRDELRQGLNLLRDEAEAYEKTPADVTSARAKLTEILARREFNQVHGPTWWDRLKYRILMWIFRLLSRFFGTSAAPTIGKVLVWSLVAIAVIVTAFFVYRAIRQSARIESIVPQVLPVSAKGWRVWMQEAQAAAGSGNWRDAVHLTYWAGISFLEQSGMWRPDQARTPREYLRLLPAGSERRPPLSALTRTLEQTWYGSRPAGPETFSEAITLVEELGCRQA